MSSRFLIPEFRPLLGRRRNFEPLYDFRRELEEFFEGDFHIDRESDSFSPSMNVKEKPEINLSLPPNCQA